MSDAIIQSAVEFYAAVTFARKPAPLSAPPVAESAKLRAVTANALNNAVNRVFYAREYSFY